MRDDTVYRVYGVKEGREKDNYFGTYTTMVEAEEQTVALKNRHWGNDGDYRQYHDNFVIRPHVVTVDFVIPDLPKPRDRYVVEPSQIQNRPGTWNSLDVRVLRTDDDTEVASYLRNYAHMYRTFEPFRQGDKMFALVAPHYTCTSVLDLQTGEIIAEEPKDADGFCPVGFYVPDWWDVHDGSIIPGSEYWDEDDEWPTGEFGFVWGCQWGDDSSWKVQYLDLSNIQSGVIRRDERFGYQPLDTRGEPWEFIRVWKEGRTYVRFTVPKLFTLNGVHLED